MILYHFTAERFLDGIQKWGLTRGCTPLICARGIEIVTGHQWLTKSPELDNQVWHDPETTSLPYDRREYRLTVDVPENEKLFPFSEFKEQFGERFLPYFDDTPEAANWFIYIGYIRPDCIRKIEKTK